MDIRDLKNACSILGLDYKNFIEEPKEIEKGVKEEIDYKALYEQQKALNEKILGNIGEISKSFDSQLEGFKKDVSEELKNQIKDLEKSFGTLKEEVNGMKLSPMRNAKSAKSISVIEKAVNQNNGIKTLNLKIPSDVKELKSFLSTKAIEELSKGIQNGIYEKASLQLDASRTLTSDLVKRILDQDKIFIQQ